MNGTQQNMKYQIVYTTDVLEFSRVKNDETGTCAVYNRTQILWLYFECLRHEEKNCYREYNQDKDESKFYSYYMISIHFKHDTK
jgi:hypothetical protein